MVLCRFIANIYNWKCALALIRGAYTGHFRPGPLWCEKHFWCKKLSFKSIITLELYVKISYCSCLTFIAVISCGSPPIISHASFSLVSMQYGATLRYKCDSGYEFPDSTTVKASRCQANKTWEAISDCQGEFSCNLY